MSRTKQTSNRKHRSKAVPVLGAAGLSLTMASGLSAAAGPTPKTPTLNAAASQEITLREDEISDVSLATFHVFDKESQTGKRLACGCGGGCCLFATMPRSGRYPMLPLGHAMKRSRAARRDRCLDGNMASVGARIEVSASALRTGLPRRSDPFEARLHGIERHVRDAEVSQQNAMRGDLI